jgi:hypothetical protein
MNNRIYKYIIIFVSLCFLCTVALLPAQEKKPLSDDEKREVLGRLYELRSSRQQITAYEDFIQREKDQDQKERDNWQRSLDLEKQATALEEQATAMQKERADLYQVLYDTVKKKRTGIGCVLRKILTIGLSRCP